MTTPRSPMDLLVIATVICYLASIPFLTLFSVAGVTLFLSLIAVLLCSFALLSMSFQNRIWYLKAAGWLLQRDVIELTDFKGETVFTLCHKECNVHGERHAPVYWFSQVGDVILKPDGNVSERSSSTYIKYWLPVSAGDRVQHILTYGVSTVDKKN